eukprot:1154938-Pelagomonas_calceolata.AAC.3
MDVKTLANSVTSSIPTLDRAVIATPKSQAGIRDSRGRLDFEAGSSPEGNTLHAIIIYCP